MLLLLLFYFCVVPKDGFCPFELNFLSFTGRDGEFSSSACKKLFFSLSLIIIFFGLTGLWPSGSCEAKNFD